MATAILDEGTKAIEAIAKILKHVHMAISRMLKTLDFQGVQRSATTA